MTSSVSGLAQSRHPSDDGKHETENILCIIPEGTMPNSKVFLILKMTKKPLISHENSRVVSNYKSNKLEDRNPTICMPLGIFVVNSFSKTINPNDTQ